MGSEASADSAGSGVHEKVRRRSKDVARTSYLQNMLDGGGEESSKGNPHRCDDCEQWLDNERRVSN